MIKNNNKSIIFACLVFLLSLDQCLGRWATTLDSLQDGTEVAFYSLINQDNPEFEYMSNDYARDGPYYSKILLRPDPGCPYTEARWILRQQGDSSFQIVTSNPNSAPYYYLRNVRPDSITLSNINFVSGTSWVFDIISDGIFAMRSTKAAEQPYDSVYLEGRTNGVITSSQNAGLSNPGTLWKIRLLGPLPGALARVSSLSAEVNGPLSPEREN